MNLLKRHIILTNEKKKHMMRAMRRATRTLLLCSVLASCTPAEDATDTGNPTLPAGAEVPLSVQSVDIEGGLEVLTRTKEKTGATTKTGAATDTRAAGETRAAMPETRATTYTPLQTEGSVITIFRQANADYPTAITKGVSYRYNGASWKPVSYKNGAFTEDLTKAIKLGAKDSRELLYAFYSPEATHSFNTYPDGCIYLSSDPIYSVNWQKKGKKDPVDKSAWKYDFCYSLPGEAEAATPATEVYNFHPEVKFSMKRVFTQLAIKVTRGKNYAGAGEIGIMLKPNNAQFHNNGKFDTATGKLVLDAPYGGEVTKKYENNPPTYQYFDLKKANDVYEDGVLIFSPGIKMKSPYTINDFSLTVDVEADGIKLADLVIPYTQLTVLMNTAQTDFDMKAGTKYVLNLKLDYRSLELEGVQVAQWEAKALGDAQAGFEWDLPGVGIQVAKADINETTAADGHGMACTENDKELLSGLIWASGNVTSSSSGYQWEALQKNHGTFYTWSEAVESCKSFGTAPNTEQYGTGWRLPTQKEFDALSHCRGDDDLDQSATWYMNSTTGVFLPWTTNVGSEAGHTGYYWSGTEAGTDKAFYFLGAQITGDKVGSTRVEATKGTKTNKYSVRCVKKAVQ